MRRFMGMALALVIMLAVLVPAARADVVAFDQEATALIAELSVDAVVAPFATSIDDLILAIQALESGRDTETAVAALSVNVSVRTVHSFAAARGSNVLKMPHARGA